MPIRPLTRSKAWIVIANALVGVLLLASVAFVYPVAEALESFHAEREISIGVVLLVAASSVFMWLGYGLWSLYQTRDRV